jgi:hypothetical protein
VDIFVPSVGHVSDDCREFRRRYYPNASILTERSGKSLAAFVFPEIASDMLLPVFGKTDARKRANLQSGPHGSAPKADDVKTLKNQRGCLRSPFFVQVL